MSETKTSGESETREEDLRDLLRAMMDLKKYLFACEDHVSWCEPIIDMAERSGMDFIVVRALASREATVELISAIKVQIEAVGRRFPKT